MTGLQTHLTTELFYHLLVIHGTKTPMTQKHDTRETFELTPAMKVAVDRSMEQQPTN